MFSARLKSFCRVMSSSPRRILPLSGRIFPKMALNRVDFPEPLEPRTVTN